MAALNFDATTVEPDAGYDVLPVGWYNVTIDESELKPTKDATGAYLRLRLNVIDGQYANRKLFTNLNIKNANPIAQEIALKQLSAIGHAVGVLQIVQSEQLHNLPLKVKVKIRKGDGDYDDQNDIVSYKNINEDVSGSGGSASGGAPAGFGSATAGAPAGFGAPTSAAPATPSAPVAPAAPAVPAHDPVAAMIADGWAQHPQNAEYYWKGNEVLPVAEVAARYPAPVATAPAAPAAPAAPVAPLADGDNPFNAGAAPAQPWATAPAAAAAAPAAAAPAEDPAAKAAAEQAQQAAPPWATPQG